MGTQPLPKGGGAPYLIFCPCLSWPNGCMDQVDATWYGRRSRPRRHCVRCGPRSHSPERGLSPLANFLSMSIVDQHGIWHGGENWSRPKCANCGQSSPSQKTGTAPQFFAHFYCGQTAGCIKMPLGMEVGLSPGDLVLDGDPATLPKGGRSPAIFGPRLL